jgi:hypothetical protein
MLAKPKKPTKSKLKAKADILASAYYRSMRPYCEAAELDDVKCGGGLQWAHIFSRSILHMRYEPYNHLILCAGHHLHYTHNPIEWTRFLEANFLIRLAAAEANRYKVGKVDYEAVIAKFTQGK